MEGGGLLGILYQSQMRKQKCPALRYGGQSQARFPYNDRDE